MIDSLVGAVVDPLARRWTAQAVGAALAFWLTGALVLVLREPAGAVCAGPATGRDALYCRLVDTGPAGAVLAAVLALAVVVGAANIGAVLAPGLTHLLAGVSWPASGWAARWTTWRIARHTRIRQRLANIAPDAGPDDTRPPWDEGRIRTRLRGYPGGAVPAPTRLGNAFAAMSQRITDRHGLRVSSCWAAFLAVLPEPARQALTAQSTTVLGRAQTLVWTVAALGWTALIPTPGWALVWVVAVLAAVAGAYLGLAHAVQAYCDLIEGQVAVFRSGLYRAVGFPLPESTVDEPKLGAELSDYLDADTGRAVPLRWTTETAP